MDVLNGVMMYGKDLFSIYGLTIQIAVDVSKYNDGRTIVMDLEKSNIILNRQLLPGDIQAGRHYMHPRGIRIGTNEITR